MTDDQKYQTEKRMHQDHIEHLNKIGDLESLDQAMRQYVAFRNEWKRKGIPYEKETP